MRYAVVADDRHRDAVLAALARADVARLAEADAWLAEVVRRQQDGLPLAVPVHVGTDLWFRLRQVVRRADLRDRDWAVVDGAVLPHVLAVWRYVAPDLQVVVVDAAHPWPLPLTAWLAGRPERCAVVAPGDLDTLDLTSPSLTTTSLTTTSPTGPGDSAGAGGPLDAAPSTRVEPREAQQLLWTEEVRHARARAATARAVAVDGDGRGAPRAAGAAGAAGTAPEPRPPRPAPVRTAAPAAPERSAPGVATRLRRRLARLRGGDR